MIASAGHTSAHVGSRQCIQTVGIVAAIAAIIVLIVFAIGKFVKDAEGKKKLGSLTIRVYDETNRPIPGAYVRQCEATELPSSAPWLIAWYSRVQAGEPYGADAGAIADELYRFHQGFGIEGRAPAPQVRVRAGAVRDGDIVGL